MDGGSSHGRGIFNKKSGMGWGGTHPPPQASEFLICRLHIFFRRESSQIQEPLSSHPVSLYIFCFFFKPRQNTPPKRALLYGSLRSIKRSSTTTVVCSIPTTTSWWPTCCQLSLLGSTTTTTTYRHGPISNVRPPHGSCCPKWPTLGFDNQLGCHAPIQHGIGPMPIWPSKQLQQWRRLRYGRWQCWWR